MTGKRAEILMSRVRELKGIATTSLRLKTLKDNPSFTAFAQGAKLIIMANY